MTLMYNAPIDGQQSSIDLGANSEQMRTFFVLKDALIEAAKDQYFTQLSKSEHMPPNYGKTMRVTEYIPLLDDRNVNDQGIDAQGAYIQNGNLYGSSKDIGKITSKLPEMNEAGGRVNRVGFTRQFREGSLVEYGFFFELTKDAIQFDSDVKLKQHLARELLNGASQMSEGILQMDLLAAAGSHVYAGAAVSKETITGEGTTPSILSYEDFENADLILTENRTPRNTKIITGSRNIDTRVVNAARFAYHGTEVRKLLTKMKDPFNNQAFIAVAKYGAAVEPVRGEHGAIDAIRFIEVPEMFHWAGVGADATAAGAAFRSSNTGGGNKYNVYPVMIVGSESFVTIGFQTDGKQAKFNIITKMPSSDTASHADPYGKTGFSSITWYYGFLGLRPERILVMYTVAPR